MSISNDDFADLSVEGQLVARLVQSGATNVALGFLVRQLRADGYGSRLEDLHLGVERYRQSMPQCFHEQKPDPLRTKKLVEAMPSGNDELMAGLANAFAERKRNAEAVKQAQRR